MKITNSSNDTVCIWDAGYNNIDSVKYEFNIDRTGKIIIDNANYYKITPPDSFAMYCEIGSKRGFFNNNKDKKGYFFVINIATLKQYSWDSICKYQLYKQIIVTKKDVETNNWNIIYCSN
jgi:hypothetical protein